ncbi:MAG: putative Chromosome partitioning protein [Nocardia sp.]|uniref:ParB/RepB/Spo0J family partition protein n=1 Tax=Nocardia sp. TaxID=1821 RepID=UPI00262AF0C5|nr:ParB N-terminal domain-containing protein [Nocardia sp.]MCU1645437.1 putative Chromosome partitioning protein [Nocardia sp.]
MESDSAPTAVTVLDADVIEPAEIVVSSTAFESESDSAAEPLPKVEALWRGPSELVIAENVRKTFDLGAHPDVRDSIKEFGVSIPILAERQPDGSLHVTEGQLRALMAADVGTEKVPVWVTDADPSIPENERRISRTLMQMNVNDRRVPMVEADRADGIALMLDLGASVTRVAKGLQRKRSEIKHNAAIAASPTARGLVDSSSYSLEQLAVIAEYETLGDTEAVEYLAQVPRSSFSYRAKQIAADRRETRTRLEASLLYAALGFGVLTSEPDTSSTEPQILPAELLETVDSRPVTEDLIAAHAHRWLVYVDVEENGQLVDTLTGELVDPDHVDWDTQGNTESPPAGGRPHADSVEYRDRWTPLYFLAAEQLSESGLRVRTFAQNNGAAGSERAEQLRAEAAQAAADRDAARQERRRVRELNKRGLAAKERREEFLGRLLSRRTPPPQAGQFVAESLAWESDLLGSFHAPRTALNLLGVSGFTSELVASIQSATASRSWVIVLGMVLGAFESRAGKDSWRYNDRGLQRYLRFLAAVGEQLEFELVDVEQAAAGLIDFHDIDIDADINLDAAATATAA